MNDDYLWDRSGPPDPDVERLEKLLGGYRHFGPAPDFGKPVHEMPRRTMIRATAWLAVAATALLAVGLDWYWNRPAEPSLEVSPLAGIPRIGRSEMRGVGRLPVGQLLETDAHSRARIDVALIGEVEVEPNSRIALLTTGASEHRLELQRGMMHARIWAPPGLFFVNTPTATAIDLGCVYTLQVDNDGAGTLRVLRGWVSFEWKGRESFVPEGAMCFTRPLLGPGTPFREDAPQKLRAALEKLDFELAAPAGGVQGGVAGGVEGGVKGGPQGGVAGGVEGGIPGGVEGLRRQREETLGVVLAEARKEDAVTLWHLLARTHGEEQGRVFDRMAQLVPPPAGVTREGVLAHDSKMLDAWWGSLQTRPASWWRMWKGPWAPRAQ